MKIQKPGNDGKLLWDIICGNLTLQVLLVAHNLKLFAVLADKPQTLEDICTTLKIERRPAEAILMVLVSIELLHLLDGFYSLSLVAQDYLLENSPTYFGDFLDMIIANRHVYSFDSLKESVLTNRAQVYNSGQLFQTHEEQIQLARAFTNSMHSHSIGPALAWPEVIDLSKYQLMLDIGGGSGAHSIGATLKYPSLQAIILDLAPVCEVAQEFIESYKLQNNIKIQALDMWSEPFPEADIHFYADIFHDWPWDKCRFLAQKSFDSLQPGGQIIIHEMLLNDQKTAPKTVAIYNIAMLLWTEGQQFSGHEMTSMLDSIGFVEIKVKHISGYWSIVTGQKL